SRDQLSGTAGIADETFGQKQYRYLMDNRKGMSVVLDIGAYIGDSALWFATFSGIRKVYAYEAHPYAYGMAKTNIELNGVNGKIELHNMAVGNEGLIRLNDGKSSPSDRLQASADGKLVRIVTLDSILAGISSNRIILKLDCEGSEFEILRKGMDLSKVYLAQLEFHNAVPGKHAEIVGALENSGFNVDVEHRTDTVTGYRDFGFIYAKRE
ncbi:MAG: FkbM family methyltransferase, partial [Candidatus Micrarchaeota archaeon]|nr:FkbM family methyltransferase [Candidatus Micrarchaeota archaeon]